MAKPPDNHTSKIVKYDAPAAIAHLNMHQALITRFSGYCMHAKTMCVTMIGAITAIAISGKNPTILWISMLPILIFSFFDTVCLALERQTRKQYNNFVYDLHSGKVSEEAIYKININKEYLSLRSLFEAFCSWSICLIYSVFLIFIFAVKIIISAN